MGRPPLRSLTALLEHTLLDDLPELGDTGIEDLLREVEFDALDLVVGPSGMTTAADLAADVPGLGPARRRRLLAAFPTVAALVAARQEDLAAVRGIGPSAARRIHDTVRATVRAA